MPDIPRRYGATRRTQRQGGSFGVRDTSAAYRRTRARLLASHPLCRYCQHHGRITVANRADHILALSLGGTSDPSNLAPACHDCNAAKGVLEQRYLQRGYPIADAVNDPELGEWIRIGRLA